METIKKLLKNKPLISRVITFLVILIALVLTNYLYNPLRAYGTFLKIIDLSMAFGLTIIVHRIPLGKWIALLVVIYACGYSFVQKVYQEVFEFFFSFSTLSIITEFKDVSGSLLVYLKWSHLLFLIPVILIIFIKPNKDKLSKLFNIAEWLSLFAVMAITLACISFLLPKVNQYNVEKYDWQVCTAYDYLYTKRILSKKQVVTDDELIAFNDAYSKTEGNEYTGIFKDHNLIMIMCESLDDEFIDETLTPTLYMLKTKGFNFADYHAPLYEYHTSDSEFLSLTGQLPSLDYGPTNYNFFNNALPSSLPHLFRNIGYSANSYHSWMENYYNRKTMHETLGFENYYGAESLDFSTESMYENYDQDLFNRIDLGDEQFFKYVITLSSHGAYSIERPDLTTNLQIINANHAYDNLNDEIKSYIASTMNLDQGLANLLMRLDEKQILDKTVIVIYGDHVPYVLSNETKKEYITNDSVPFYIYNSAIEGMEVAKTCCTSDVYPTLANMFGLDTSSYYKAGIDVFSNNESTAVYMDGTTYNGEKSDKALELFKMSQGILLADFYK